MENRKKVKRKTKKVSYLIDFKALDSQTKEFYDEVYQEFDKSSVYELREVARQMGVKSATTMDKKTLVTAMTKQRVSSTVYYPTKETSVAPVTIGEAEQLTRDYQMKSFVMNPITCKGILSLTDEGAWLRVAGFVPDDSDVFAPMLMVNEYNLLSGDEITGQVRFMEKSGRSGLYKLQTINGQNAEIFRRLELEGADLPNEIVKLDKGSTVFNVLNTLCPVSKGQRKLIVGLGSLKMDSLAREFSLKLHEQGFETINLFLDESPESVNETIALPGSSLVLSCSSVRKYDEGVSLAVDYARRIAPYGRNVAIILNNGDILQEKTLKFAFCAGRYTQNGSITTAVFSSSIELNQIINRLSRVSNSIAVFKNNFGDDPLVDITRTYSENESQLPKRERQALRVCRKHLKEQFVEAHAFMATYEVLLASSLSEES